MTRRPPHRIAAGAIAVTIAAAAAIAAAPASAAPAAPTTSDLDFYADTVPGLRAGSVFESVTFERFGSLLADGGRFAFAFGGPADAGFAAAAPQIDAAATAAGVDAVYTFDPRLDGAEVDIRTSSIPEIAALWNDLLAGPLGKDAASPFVDGGDAPVLFVYDGDRVVDGADDRIVASVPAPADGQDATAYRASVDAVFSDAGDEPIDTRSQFDFFSEAVNSRHAAQYPDPARFGGDIFTADDGEDFVLQSVTYPELVALLESDEEHTILFGGTWCHNTRAVIKDVNRAAAASGTEPVYVFDLRLDGWGSDSRHIRDHRSALAYLYTDLVNEHLPNLRTQYPTDGTDNQRVDYRLGADLSTPVISTAAKLQVPYLIRHDGSDTIAPIQQDWIRDNGDGTFREYMTEWWWVQDLPGTPGRTPEADWPAVRQANVDFAAEAIAQIDEFFAEEPAEATVPTAPAAPTVSVDGTAITVSWSVPANGGSPITGYRVSLNGGSAVEVPADATSYTFTGLSAGGYAASVVAVNELGASPQSSPSAVVNVVEAPTPAPGDPLPETDEPRELQLAVSGDLRPGGSIEVIGSGYSAEIPAVRVELHSTPSLLGTPAVADDGTFRLAATIPSDVSAGAHSVVVFVDGVEVARTAVTIAAAPGAPVGLAATGADAAGALGLGALAMLALGTALVLRRRTA